ncbi:hypothetical protein ACFSQP_00280 [Bizionia sediminis]|uniref:Uncharacterized protein n=1 Tax=Bizionia sediminis TaxID=1737064 RepID=A0ABW5KN88_9FLAO
MATANAYGAGMGALVWLIAIVGGSGDLDVVAASAVAYGANASAGVGFVALLNSI